MSLSQQFFNVRSIDSCQKHQQLTWHTVKSAEHLYHSSISTENANGIATDVMSFMLWKSLFWCSKEEMQTNSVKVVSHSKSTCIFPSRIAILYTSLLCKILSSIHELTVACTSMHRERISSLLAYLGLSSLLISISKRQQKNYQGILKGFHYSCTLEEVSYFCKFRAFLCWMSAPQARYIVLHWNDTLL